MTARQGMASTFAADNKKPINYRKMNQFKTKPHYHLLDALRGVAALIVIGYHISEGFATSPADLAVNHGYLAVDFFFMLSGFVIAYAYDGRWGSGLSIWGFLKRRLIRLHPMVTAGVVLGVASFCAQGCTTWSGEHVSAGWIVVSALLALCMIPAVPGTGPEIRGNGEMFPINGPEWSLFFEYIGNIIYATLIRRLGTRALGVLTGFAGVCLILSGVYNISGYGGIGMGWTLSGWNFAGGMLRMMFAFSMGMLLQRTFRPRRVPYAFVICSLVLVVLMAMPFVGSAEEPWMNGLYDALCVTAVFPAVLYVGACGKPESERESRVCDFLGRLSYPLYIVHYPFMYLLYDYVWSNGLSFGEALPQVAAAVVGSIATAWILLRVYDTPVRKALAERFLKSS